MDPSLKSKAKETATQTILTSLFLGLVGFVALFFTNPFVLAENHRLSHSQEQQQLVLKLDAILAQLESAARERSYELEIDGLRDKIDATIDELEKLQVEVEEAPQSTLIHARKRRIRDLQNKKEQLERDLVILLERGE